MDPKAILASVFDGEQGEGLPPRELPVLMVVNTATSEVRYWKLTDNVRLIQLESKAPDEVRLKVMNEAPLRVELWLNSDKAVDVEIELKDDVAK